MSRANVFVLTERSQLERLRTGPRPRVERIEVCLPGIEEPLLRRSQDLLDRHWGSCGCEVGAAAVVLAVFPALIAAAMNPTIQVATWAFAARLAAVAVVSGAIGKVTGILYSRARCRQALAQLARVATVAPAGGVEGVA